MNNYAKIIICFLTISLITTSCTTINVSGTNNFQNVLNSQLNKMTYDEALMTWGEPVSNYEGDNIFIVTWGAESRGTAVIPIENTLFAVPIDKGWKLQLSFNKQSRKMVAWKYDKW